MAFSKIATAIFGSRNDRYIKSLNKNIQAINALEPDMQALSDAELKEKTNEFRERLKAGASLDEILNEAFAVCREASVRTLGLRHYDVQLIGGIVLHEGKIAEMKTGEGKTLVATLAVYLNAISGEGVHVVTVNEYLAQRDSELLRPLYEFLGLTCAVCTSQMEMSAKIDAYRADITYGTNNELGFDYLRTNMVMDVDSRLQRQLNFAIVDEVDSILIDEARTPLIISGQVQQDNDVYHRLNNLVPHLRRQKDEEDDGADFTVDEKDKQIGFTEQGHDRVETLLRDAGLLVGEESIYSPANIGLFHHLNACLRAHHLYHKDVDYIVSEGQVVIVDEFTGRTLPGRRWSEGLHQAVEAKEKLTIQNENQTLASITFQNYFRQYKKLSGMTGTADTEAPEFYQIYGLETIVIPTNLPTVRDDEQDAIYLNQKGKFNAIIEDIKEHHEAGQPLLVGTASIEVSELLSNMLTEKQIKHEVLNAKQHAREAEIIANAGCKGAVTIATNMAGRGTDIVLGGNLQVKLSRAKDEAEAEQIQTAWEAENKEVIALGGLRIIGTERHESRRIDNQLRGRAGRQGDPGSSKFYVSLEDDLMRLFASDRMSSMMQKLGMTEDEAIEHRMISNALENAQRRVESRNFDIRKSLIEFDDVSNEQRRVIYSQRNDIMESDSVSDILKNMRESAISQFVETHVPSGVAATAWDHAKIENAFLVDTGISISLKALLEQNAELDVDMFASYLLDLVEAAYVEKVKPIPEDSLKGLEKYILLQAVDMKWREHLKQMDYLREGINLRGVRAQKDPRQEYKRESFYLFESLLDRIAEEVTRVFSHIQFQPEESAERLEEEQQESIKMTEEHASVGGLTAEPLEDNPYKGTGRNSLCPCGSGKKYKHCHGRVA